MVVSRLLSLRQVDNYPFKAIVFSEKQNKTKKMKNKQTKKPGSQICWLSKHYIFFSSKEGPTELGMITLTINLTYFTEMW